MKSKNFKDDFDRRYYVNRVIRIRSKTKDRKMIAMLDELIDELKQYELWH